MRSIRSMVDRIKKGFYRLDCCWKEFFSTPVMAYTILLLINIVLLIHGFQADCDFSKNIGYSLLASIVAALLIDAGNTRALHESEKRQLKILKEELIYAFRQLRETAENLYDSWYDGDKSKLSFYQRIDLLSDPELSAVKKTEQREILLGFSYPIEKIKDDSAKLLQRLYDNSSLSIITAEQRKQVRQINNRANLIYTYFKSGKEVFAVKCIKTRLLPFYFEFEPEEESQFTEEFRLDVDIPCFAKQT